MGYSRAGFEVVGVDIKPQPNYPFRFIQGDVIHGLRMLSTGRWMGWNLTDFDVIHASPPCQAYSAGARMRLGFAKDHPKLIEPVRDRMLAWGGPYVIENVPEAPLRSSTLLCGSSFGLAVRRHRRFESNLLLMSPGCAHQRQDVVVGVYGDHPEDSVIRKGHPAIRARSVEHAQEALGIDWMPKWAELKESIPPAYTEYLGTQLLEHLSVGASHDSSGTDA